MVDQQKPLSPAAAQRRARGWRKYHRTIERKRKERAKPQAERLMANLDEADAAMIELGWLSR